MRAKSVVEYYQWVSANRALTEAESGILERAIRRHQPAGTYRKWSIKDNAALLESARVKNGLKAYAEREGRTYASCQRQLDRLKKQRRRRGIACVGRFFYNGEIEL